MKAGSGNESRLKRIHVEITYHHSSAMIESHLMFYNLPNECCTVEQLILIGHP